jgi:hypothetical protein
MMAHIIAAYCGRYCGVVVGIEVNLLSSDSRSRIAGTPL